MFKINPSSIGDPDIYLEAKLMKIRHENGVWAWANIPERYVKESVANVDNYLTKLVDARWQFTKKKSDNPFVRYYAPEMDKTPDLVQELASCYQHFIGVLRWVVEIGRANKITKV